jgi:subtilisin family serine protease
MKKLWLTPILVLALLLVAVLPAIALAPPQLSAEQPANPPGNPHTEAGYIVVLKPGGGPPAEAAAEAAQRTGGQVGYVYTTVLEGFSIRVPEQALEGIRNNPRVDYVTTDDPVSIQQSVSQLPTGIRRSFAAGNPNLDIDFTDDLRVDVDVAVLDTGIDRQHPDLNVAGGIDCTLRTRSGFFFTYYCGPGNGGDDDHYHGTHVAGTIGALDNGDTITGIAPGARLWAVKVLNSQGSGTTSGIIAGIDWVAKQGNIEVINMSLGGSGRNTAYETAINNAVSLGVVVVVAAGNSDADSTNYSPAFVPNAITVSALADFNGAAGGGAAATCRPDVDDTLADFSNWGAPVDIAAPGVCILSTYPVERGGSGTISGTSMAAPHVAGAAALLASAQSLPKSASTALAIRDTLVNSGNSGWVDDSGDGVQERLLDLSSGLYAPKMVAGGGGGTPPTPEPTSISLTATAGKEKNSRWVDLAWAGAAAGGVDLYRNGTLITVQPASAGTYRDSTLPKGTTFTYRVCNVGTQVCSPDRTVFF